MSKQDQTFSRKDFLKVSGFAGLGLVIGMSLFGCKEEGAKEGEPVVPLKETEINAYIIIREDGTATIMAKNPEIGQGIRTSLPMILAEELDLPWEKVNVEQALLDDRMTPQYAGGSQGVTTNYEVLRQAGAAAKAVLIAAAAKQWGVAPEACTVKEGVIHHEDKSLHYGEVAVAAAALELPAKPVLKNPKDFTIVGKSTPDVDLHKIVTGQPLFGLDQEIEGMVYATILKPEVMNATVVSFDATEALAQPGVINVIQIKGDANPTNWVDGVAIVAEHTWAAFNARDKVKIEWKSPEGYIRDTADVYARLEEAAKEGVSLREDGNFVKIFQRDLNQWSATYKVPYVGHNCMEPMNFIADVKEKSATLIGPTQLPGPARRSASQITGIPEENITVRFSRMGGGFGRRLFNDYANEAVYLSQQLKKPVQVVWDRESDFRGDYYRPAGVYQMKAAWTGTKLSAFEVQASTTSRNLYRQRPDQPQSTEIFPDQAPAGMVPNFHVSYKGLLTNIHVGALRVPGVNATTFAYQCFLDELAEKVGMDPIDFQLRMIGTEARDMPYNDHGGPSYNTGKLRHVIEEVRKKSGWDQALPEGKYRGFAGQMVFGVYVAQVVEIRMVNDKVKVDKVYCVTDCGRVINPIGADAQVQGGITDALSTALYEGITFAEGKLVEQNFDRYPKLRMKDSPEVEVHFVESDAHPQGLGEPSYPVIIPALCNAVYAATGKRVRELPLRIHGLV